MDTNFAVNRRLTVVRPVEGARRGVPRRGGRQVQAAHHDRLRARLTFPLPRDGIQRGVVPGAWRAGQVWRHLNFFQHKAFIHADVPRVSHARGMTSER